MMIGCHYDIFGRLAQLVEHWCEVPSVISSNLISSIYLWFYKSRDNFKV